MLNSKTLFTRFLKWRYKHISNLQFVYLLSIIVGFLAGIGSVILKNFTHFIQNLLEGNFIKYYHHILYFIFPILGLILVFIIKKYFIKREIHHGIPSTLFSISKRNGIIERYKIYASLITAPITVGFGGSVGLQGPAVSTGAALASNVAQLFHMNTKTRMLLIGCATAGAMSSMFKAPIAAIIFAVEIFSLDIASASLIPLLLASVSAIFTSYFFLGTEVLFGFEIQDDFKMDHIFFYIFLGVVTGMASVYFSKIFFKITHYFEKFKNPLKRLLFGGIAIGLILFLVPPLYGEGYGIINNLLHGDHLAAIGDTVFDEYIDNIWVVIGLLAGITIFKAIAMTTTFAAGGVGGIFIPTLVMGSALGNLLAKILNNIGMDFNVSESNFTLLGMTGLMAGVLHAPLTAIFLIAEITGGYSLFVPLMLVSAISFSITRYFISNSIYTLELAKRGALITHDKDKNVLMMLDIDKVIETNFVNLSPDMNLGEIVNNAVAKSTRNHFPVVNDENEFLGILSLNDIRSVMFKKDLYETVQVRSLMHAATDIIYYEKDSTEEILNKFKKTGSWNLVVVKNGKYHGFISKSRLLTAYRRKLIQVTS